MIKEKQQFARRTENLRESFVREILKVTAQEGVISFAGGLPNPSLFPVEKLALAMEQVMAEKGKEALQYATTEGYLPLREYIADRHSKRYGFTISPEEVIILTGSQQGIDIIGKIFLDTGDKVILEGPSYLGAIQSLSPYEPEFDVIPLEKDGIDIDILEERLWNYPEDPKFFYCIPNHHNPAGYTYSYEKRVKIAELIKKHSTYIIEDAAYSELSFEEHNLPEMKQLLPEQTILLGSFSKIISPGLRTGYLIAPKEIIRKIAMVKQAGDLHTNFLSQHVVYNFLMNNDLDEHLRMIRSFYRKQSNYMMEMIRKHLPGNIKYSPPDGGMFIWMELPDHIDAEKLFIKACEQKVVFVPGCNFYPERNQGKSSIRLNFSNPGFEQMERGMKVLGGLVK